MYRKVEMALCLVALVLSLVLSPSFAWAASQATNANQNQPGEDHKESTQSKKEDSVNHEGPPATIKSAQTDEGQLATVSNAKIPSYSKVYVAPILGGFENYVIAGLRNKKVPLIVVMDLAKAEYEISGVSDSEKAGWAKMLFIGSQNSNEQASIKIVDLKTGEVIFGYSVHKTNSVRGKQSAGEACAKHIKQIVAE